MTETLQFLNIVPVSEFLFSTKWSPNTTITHNWEVKKMFGIIPLISGTLLVTFIAILIGGPFGILTAIYISHYTSKKNRYILKTLIEIVAGIPSVVYGYFAVTIVSPALHKFGNIIGINISQESALCSGMVIGLMIMPLIVSLIDDVLHATPKSLYYGSLVLGATKSETICSVILPAAFPGILSAILLGLSRAIGETMIVLMATGLTPNLTANPVEPITTMTVQIATLLTGDQTFSNTETLSAYAIGFVLFIITWILNVFALSVVNKYRRSNHY